MVLRTSHHSLDHILVAILDIRIVLDTLIITRHILIVIERRVDHYLVEKTTEMQRSSTKYMTIKTMEDSKITTIAKTQSQAGRCTNQCGSISTHKEYNCITKSSKCTNRKSTKLTHNAHSNPLFARTTGTEFRHHPIFYRETTYGRRISQRRLLRKKKKRQSRDYKTAHSSLN